MTHAALRDLRREVGGLTDGLGQVRHALTILQQQREATDEHIRDVLRESITRTMGDWRAGLSDLVQQTVDHTITRLQANGALPSPKKRRA